MERLFQFLYKYRAFFLFICLELFSLWLIVRNNQYQGILYFNSSNAVIGSLNRTTQNLNNYFSLKETNALLGEELTRLQKELEIKNALLLRSKSFSDSSNIKHFDYLTAQVINNSVARYSNFITIDKGKKDGLSYGMAVINSLGVVGKIKSVSSHFSLVTSLLNTDVMVSSVIQRTGHFGTIQWDGISSQFVKLKFIPRHVKPLVGDSIVTSGYNSVFPEGIKIGTIEEFYLQDEALFYEIQVKLSNDFQKLTYVTVVKSLLNQEIDSLEKSIYGN